MVKRQKGGFRISDLPTRAWTNGSDTDCSIEMYTVDIEESDSPKSADFAEGKTDRSDP